MSLPRLGLSMLMLCALAGCERIDSSDRRAAEAAPSEGAGLKGIVPAPAPAGEAGGAAETESGGRDCLEAEGGECLGRTGGRGCPRAEGGECPRAGRGGCPGAGDAASPCVGRGRAEPDAGHPVVHHL